MNESSSRPFVFINAAMSADGKIATIERKQTRISGSLDFDRADELRATSDAIMVGIGTVLSDNPSLTVKSAARRENRRAQGLDENPARIVVDSMARTPVDADIFKKGAGRKIIAVSGSAPKENVKELSKEAEIIVAGEKTIDLEKLLTELTSRGINRLMVEGGATLNWGLISAGLVDEIYIFIGILSSEEGLHRRLWMERDVWRSFAGWSCYHVRRWRMEFSFDGRNNKFNNPFILLSR